VLRRLVAWIRRLVSGRGGAPDDRYPMF